MYFFQGKIWELWIGGQQKIFLIYLRFNGILCKWAWGICKTHQPMNRSQCIKPNTRKNTYLYLLNKITRWTTPLSVFPLKVINHIGLMQPNYLKHHTTRTTQLFIKSHYLRFQLCQIHGDQNSISLLLEDLGSTFTSLQKPRKVLNLGEGKTNVSFSNSYTKTICLLHFVDTIISFLCICKHEQRVLFLPHHTASNLLMIQSHSSLYLVWNLIFLLVCRFADLSAIMRHTISLLHSRVDVSNGFDFPILNPALKGKSIKAWCVIRWEKDPNNHQAACLQVNNSSFRLRHQWVFF